MCVYELFWDGFGSCEAVFYRLKSVLINEAEASAVPAHGAALALSIVRGGEGDLQPANDKGLL